MRKSIFIGLVAILGLIGCSRNQEIDVPDANLSLFARTESPADTKTVVESGVHVYWEPVDEIAVFMGEKSAKFTTDITAASGTATFKGTFGDSEWPEEPDLWAVYPYSEDAVFDGETVTTTLPSEQVAREGSFGKDMNLAIAHSSGTTLQFYNVGGGVRFSVTEEGIKKVMFEGLSGEIISGKVKIGLDENGKPVVQEVTGGSQFITLLPPSGQEAFVPGAWYYIVAIPGSLEGGYKMRFYKDSDYAKKVSEKAVEIKRSIFGSLEKADKGIGYEAQTTHFPETEEEWDKSISLTKEIGNTVASFLHSLSSANLDDIKIIEEQIRRIDGIEEVIMNTEEKALSIMQKDSIWVNYYSPHSSNGFEMPFDHSALANSISTSQSSQAIRQSRISSRNKTYNNPDEDYYINSKRKALFLVPPFVYNENANISDIADCLVRAGFPKSNILIKDKASDFTSPFSSDILQFKGSNISNYDFIFIRTHGGTGYYAKKPKGERIENTTILFSSTKYDKKTVKKIVDDGQLLWSDVAIGALDENEDGVIDGYYLCMTPSFLKGAQYENSCVIITACSSARILVNGNGGSMIQTFLDQKAGIVSGYTGTTMDYMDVPLSVNLVCLMSNGLSFQDAIKYIQNSVVVNQYYQQVKNYYLENYEKLGYSNDDLVWLPLSVNPRNFHYEPVTLSRPYLLLDPYPILNEVTPVNGDCLLSWESDLTPFDFDWPMVSSSGETIGNTIRSLTVHFEVYLDDDKLDKSIYSNDTEKKVSCSLSSGDHEWYVIAKIMEDDTIIASYQSSIGKFNVTEQVKLEAIDLGLSVKWANMNLGANRPEEYGDYYAWGETEPYYISLDPLVWRSGKESGYTWSSYKWCMGDYDSITKYGVHEAWCYNGITDGKVILDPEDDAAHVKLGGNWRMPTMEELAELLDNCSWEHYAEENGILGRWMTGPNGNKIFLPAAGRLVGTNINLAEESGYFWSSSLFLNSFSAQYMEYSLGSSLSDSYTFRECGFSIRPVYDDSGRKPEISVSPTSINYGNVIVGEGLGNATGRVEFTNTGTANLSIVRIACPEGFSFSSAYSFPIVLSPGDSKTIVFAFKPTEHKTYSGDIRIYSSASNGVCIVRVIGNGVY